jgi:hypothetical protein
MSRACEKYIQKMGYMPSYKLPEKLDEDEEFEYFKVRVPRQYIKEHIEMGEVWPHDVDTNIVGTQDASVVLGVMFLLVYTGVDYLEEDDDFLYYKVRVPKVFLDACVPGTNLTYRASYETENYNPEVADEIECERIPKAGEPMLDKEELAAIKKVKKSEPLLYEVVFKCKDEDCGMIFTEIGSDLFDMLYSRSCSVCACIKLETIGCKVLVEEDEDG